MRFFSAAAMEDLLHVGGNSPRERWIGGVRFALDTRRYMILKLLGRGAFGVVVAAADLRTGKNVAIKHICPIADSVSDARHILREMAIMRFLRHRPNVSRGGGTHGQSGGQTRSAAYSTVVPTGFKKYKLDCLFTVLTHESPAFAMAIWRTEARALSVN